MIPIFGNGCTQKMHTTLLILKGFVNTTCSIKRRSVGETVQFRQRATHLTNVMKPAIERFLCRWHFGKICLGLFFARPSNLADACIFDFNSDQCKTQMKKVAAQVDFYLHMNAFLSPELFGAWKLALICPIKVFLTYLKTERVRNGKSLCVSLISFHESLGT